MPQVSLTFAELATFVLALVAFGPVLNTLRSGAVQSQKELIEQLLEERKQTNDELGRLRERVHLLENENAALHRQIADLSKRSPRRPAPPATGS